MYNKTTCKWGCSDSALISLSVSFLPDATSKLMSGRWTFLPVTAFSYYNR